MVTKSSNHHTISKRFYNENQSWILNYTVGIGDEHRLLVEIRRNAYDQQSYGRVSRWDGTRWHRVVNVPISECQCRVVSYVQPEGKAREDLFVLDAYRLLEEAKKIIA